MKHRKGSETSLHPQMEDDYRYEITLVIEKSDIYFSKFEKAKPYIPFHWQNSYELIYNIDGEQQIIFNNESVSLTKNDCIIINPCTLHAVRSSNDNSFILIMLPQSFVKKYMPTDKLLHFDLHVHSKDPQIIEKQNCLKQVLNNMNEISDLQTYGYQLRFNSLVFELLYQLFQGFSTQLPSAAKKISAKHQNLLADIINYVYENYRHNISIEEAAAICHLQPQYFCRFFKKHMGKTFLEFVNEIRMYYAYIDITKTDLPISQISAQNGFTNYDTFLKLFRNKYHCTPSDFRTLPKHATTTLFRESIVHSD